MSSEVELDPVTGLPAIGNPDYFWRIGYMNVLGRDRPAVFLVKNRPKPISKFMKWLTGVYFTDVLVIDSEWIGTVHPEDLDDALVTEARIIINRVRSRIAQERAATLFEREYVGDYPPKKIGD